MRWPRIDDIEGPMNAFLKVALAVTATGATACGGGAAPPFDTLPKANVTAFRLQNFEPPPPPPGAPAPAPGAMIPGLPPQITQWMQQGAGGLEQLIPPGLLPPGMLGGLGQPPAAPPPPQQDTAPRFHGFRILGQTAVVDERLKEELMDVLGDEDNFEAKHANCMFAEMGLSWQAGPGTPPSDLLVSFSCNQMQGRTFAWPHGATGMTPSAVKELTSVVQKLWPPGM